MIMILITISNDNENDYYLRIVYSKKNMKKIFLSSLLLTGGVFLSSGLSAQEELTVRGNVLYSDQVNALKTPVPVINVPVSVSIITDNEIARQGYQQLGDLV